MRKNNIERSLREAIHQAPTLDFEKLAAMPVNKMTRHDPITMQQEKRKVNSFRGYAAAASFCLIVLVFISGWFIQNRLPDSVVALDVNPSIEIVINKQDQVLSVKALNEDSQSIVSGQDYRNADLIDTVDTLLASMITQGYLNADKNTIMISVENRNIGIAEKLALLLDEEIRDSVSSQKITPNVLRQVFIKDKKASSSAEQYHISIGKMRLIQEMMSSNPALSINDLAAMSMEDLLAVSKKYEVDLDQFIQSDGDDSDQEKIEEETRLMNQEQNRNNISKSDEEQDDNDASQQEDDQDDNDVSQPVNIRHDNDTSLPGDDQEGNKSAWPDTDWDSIDTDDTMNQDESDSSQKDADTDENNKKNNDSGSGNTLSKNSDE